MLRRLGQEILGSAKILWFAVHAGVESAICLGTTKPSLDDRFLLLSPSAVQHHHSSSMDSTPSDLTCAGPIMGGMWLAHDTLMPALTRWV
jgi:hypothetical protein